MPRSALTRRIAVTLTGAAAVLAATALPAAAHVAVAPDTAVQGTTAELTFRVPDEEATASTVELRLQIPTDHPIAQVLARPIPGWTVTEHTVTLATPLVTDDGTFTTAVDEIDWSGGSIAPGQYQDFAVSADPLPENTTRLVFKAVQTYSNGDVVRWIDVPAPGQPEPDHPAAVLTLVKAAATTSAAPAVPQAAAPSSSSAFGGAALGDTLGALGLAAGVAALAVSLRTRRRDLS